jgi:polyribonucleotide nucleotidyltransferase
VRREVMKVMVNRVAMVLSIVILSLSLFFQTVHAEIFKWVDEKGTVHFTEDPATIPEKYREKVKSRMTEEDLMSPEERARAKKQYEEEIREKLKKEGKEYDAKEFERKVKELEERQKRERVEGKCEIVSYSQYDVNLGGGFVSGHVSPGGSVHGAVVGERKETCVDLVIRNNDREPKTITERNILATTSRSVVTRWNIPSPGSHSKPTPAETKNKFNPKTVLIRIQPGETYRGSICFDRQLPIAKLELEGL